jgi:hypothetical protein
MVSLDLISLYQDEAETEEQPDSDVGSEARDLFLLGITICILCRD